MAEEQISIMVRLRGALRARKDADQVANAVDNIGDQADQTSRRLDRMNVSSGRAMKALRGMGSASNSTRVNLGPFSTSLRLVPVAIGGIELAAKRATPALLSLTEAAATTAGGAGAAGGVGLLALGQASVVAKLGLGGLEKALGGNRKAIDHLNPRMRGLYRTVHTETRKLRRESQRGLMPGLSAGTRSASRNFGIVNQLARRTGATLGGVAQDAGGLFGSKSFGADLQTVGKSNTVILDRLGHAGINLADAFRQVAVEASPLARSLAQNALQGTKTIDVWAKNSRASGRMARFFREARTELGLLGSIGSHAGRGIINLFGAQDVDGTRTLRNFDRLTADFERWTNNPATRRSVGDAIVGEIPKAVGSLMTAIASNLPQAGVLGARTFFNGFMHADVWGKLLAGGFLAKKLGLFGVGKNLLTGGKGGKGGIAGALLGGAGRGSSPANPMWVAMVGGGKNAVEDAAKKGGIGATLAALGRKAIRVPGVVEGGAVAVGAPIANELDKLVTHAIFGQNNAPGNPLVGPNNARTMIENAVRGAVHGGGRPAGALPAPQGPFGNGTLSVTAPVTLNGREIARAEHQYRVKQRARRG